MDAFSSVMINLKKKNVKAGKHDDLDKAVFKRFMSVRLNNIPISGLALQEKASDLAKILYMTLKHGMVPNGKHGIMLYLRQC